MTIALQSDGMTPIKNVPNWVCRHCKHPWPIVNMEAIANPELRPKQCPNRKCRAADWDRPKIKPGRPKASKSRTQPVSRKRKKK